MPRMPFLVVLFSASVVVPLPAGAQSPGPSYAPMELTADDLGEWDVALTAKGPMGGRMTVKGVETNTIGCDGPCIVTKTTGQLNSLMNRSSGGGSPWWRDYDGASAGGLHLKQTNQFETPPASSSPMAAESVALPTRPAVSRTVQRIDNLRTMRISVDYPDPDRRIVTTYAIGPGGQPIQTARIVYTRRR